MKRILVLVSLLLVTTGCNKIKEKLAEKAPEKAIETATGAEEVDLNGSSGGVTVKDAKGGVVKVGTNAKLPEDWPALVPVYPGAKLISSFSANDSKMVHFESKDSVDDIAKFYKDKMSGLTKEAELELGGARTLAYKKGKERVGITIARQESGGKDRGATTVQLTYSAK